MFQFTGFPTYTYGFSIGRLRSSQPGFPIQTSAAHIGYLLLTAAFRSLSRLSSALSAKASSLRSFLLDQLPSYV